MSPAAPIVEELLPPPEPWDAALRLARLPYLLFLDSAERHPIRGRYSFVTADPVEWIERSAHSPSGPDPFFELKQRLARFPAETLNGLPPFQGGVAGLFGYGLQHAVERIPRPRFVEFCVPDLVVGLYDWVIAFDHREGRAWLISTGYPEIEVGQRHFRAAARLRQTQEVLQGPFATPTSQTAVGALSLNELSPQLPLPGWPSVTINSDPSAYLAAVRRASEYVHAGDCFQVNLSQRLLHPATLPSLELYRRLRERNPAPFAGYLDLGHFAVVSASPERFLKVTGGEVETRPIKGTRPRGATPDEDRRLAEELRQSAKDRAEN